MPHYLKLKTTTTTTTTTNCSLLPLPLSECLDEILLMYLERKVEEFILVGVSKLPYVYKIFIAIIPKFHQKLYT